MPNPIRCARRRRLRRVPVELLLGLALALTVVRTAAEAVQPVTPADAARLLTQASFGPRPAEIAAVARSGVDAWIDAQLALPARPQLPRLLAGGPPSRARRMALWWDDAVHGREQLRLRVALALSEIFVVSDQAAPLDRHPEALAAFWDLLTGHAFGNFRALLEAVTLSPAMGVYLNMLGNQKPDPARHIRADENFAREVMQLFTIGLYQLDAEGRVQRDAAGQPLPSYDSREVADLARLFTGWSWEGATFGAAEGDFTRPMVPFEAQHDRAAKRLPGGVQVAAGSDARSDLAQALDALFAHPNTPAFVCRQLIQRLVTSNPSPAYVGRIAAVFRDNGHGVRGDLAAVVRALLRDAGARSAVAAREPGYGKRREPLVAAAHLWRALDGRDAQGGLSYQNPEVDLHQAPLSAPSVFNFFRPDFAPPGPLPQHGLVAPEFQLASDASQTLMHNFFANAIIGHAVAGPYTQDSEILLHLDDYLDVARAADPAALVDRLDLVLMAGAMPASMRHTLIETLQQVDTADGGAERVLVGAFLVVTSQQYLIQR